MTRGRSIWFINDTTLTILGDVSAPHFPERQRLALVAWLEHHGGDPKHAPLANTFVRLVDDPAIEYDVFERDDEGRRFLQRDAANRPDPDLGFVRRRHRVDLDEPPLPFPDEFQVQMP